MLIDTARLLLRPMVSSDFESLYAVIGDPITMQFYPEPFDKQRTLDWIERNMRRHAEDGTGLRAVTLRSTGEMIGDCGAVWQPIDGSRELEIGYHIRRDCWRRGYATEAARAVMTFAFGTYAVDHLISLIRPENLPSRRVAEKNGLRIDREVEWKGIRHYVYAIKREDFLTEGAVCEP
ncbi:MAG TPA: GNAT family N-acetyltransferase [Terriglobales bacterium]|nr:GNAT family N-acetyltransferase [Terriglobales bacterium]